MKKQNVWRKAKKGLVFLLIVTGMIWGCLPAPEYIPVKDDCYAAEKDSANVEDHVERIIEKTNEERIKYGLGLLTEDKTLASAAALRAYEQREQFSHVRPDGTSCFTVFSQFGIKGTWRGENLARGMLGTHDSVMLAWMQSEGHRNNILNEKFTRIGVGYVEVQGRGYWCQLFSN